MAISVITNFNINKEVPIDSRLVVESSAERISLQYKYEGLKVYQKDDKKTYLWDGSTWVGDGNGIYGGSGDLIVDTEVYTGIVGANLGDSSYSFSLKANTTNEVYYKTNFLNNDSGSGVGVVEVKNQFNYTDGSLVLRNGPYISFNPLDEVLANIGGISIGTGDGSSINTTERVRISSDGKIGINSSSPLSTFEVRSQKSSLSAKPPVVIDYDDSGDPFIGFNYSKDNGMYDSGLGYSYLSFNYFGGIDIYNKLWEDDGPTTPIKSFAISPANDIDSPVSILADVSAHDWDSGSARNPQLKTIPTYLHSVEHKFSKIQINNWITVEAAQINAGIGVGILYITDGGNSFDVTLSVGTLISNIKIYRKDEDKYYDVPTGAEINIKFRHPSGTKSGNSIIKLSSSDTDTTSNIRSSYDDSVIGGTLNQINIIHDAENWEGDIITFRKTDTYWDIVNINREKQISDFLSGVDTWIDCGNTNIFEQITNTERIVGLTHSEVYGWETFNSMTNMAITALTGLLASYKHGGTSLREKNTPNILEISKSKSNKITLRGSFSYTVDGSNLYTGRNIWTVIKIVDSGYLPSRSVFGGSVIGYAYSVNGSVMTDLGFYNGSVTISPDITSGSSTVLLEFNLSATASYVTIEVSIPPITWVTD